MIFFVGFFSSMHLFRETSELKKIPIGILYCLKITWHKILASNLLARQRRILIFVNLVVYMHWKRKVSPPSGLRSRRKFRFLHGIDSARVSGSHSATDRIALYLLRRSLHFQAHSDKSQKDIIMIRQLRKWSPSFSS